jgi:hypothetical protein
MLWGIGWLAVGVVFGLFIAALLRSGGDDR